MVFFRAVPFSLRAELRRAELDESRSSILDKQTECLDFLQFEKENELNKSEHNYILNKRHIESKFNSQICFVKEQASSELKILDSHGQKLGDLEKRTDIFQKRLEMLNPSGKWLMDSSFEASLRKQAESLKKEWDTLLAYKVPNVFDLKFGLIRGVM